MKIEVPEKKETFKSVVWSAMNEMSVGETFEVPSYQLGYLHQLVHLRNKEENGVFSVITAPVIESGILCGLKTVHVVRKK